jgi:thiamine biosynthesis lipoprotein
MGMHITVEIVDPGLQKKIFEEIFSYFAAVDERFSTYKETSEMSLINAGKITKDNYSDEMKQIFMLAEQTKKETRGYFDIYYHGIYDPSGIVKGWAIHNASKIIQNNGYKNYFIDAGGDIQVNGKNASGTIWRVGIRNPFDEKKIIKVLSVADEGVATSGTYIRGHHIYNPKKGKKLHKDIVSLTVVGSNIYEADRFATAAFAMGREGIFFIEQQKGFEGYMIDTDGIATYTTGFNTYVLAA